MARIRSKNTGPEIIVRKYLFRQGLRYRLYSKGLPGTPDIVLPKYKAVIFVNGCFWHRHKNCIKATVPKSNEAYWKKKFSRNLTRDMYIKNELQSMGWKFITIWECEIKNPESRETRLKKLILELKN